MLSKKRVRDLFRYDSVTGILIWNARPHPKANHKMVGTRAGSRRLDGHHQVRIDGQMYTEHQVIWLLVYGVWPDEIDHENRIRDDNRINNLRKCSRSQNNANRPAQRNNKLGVKGVFKMRDRYVVNIKCEDMRIRKSFPSLIEATDWHRTKHRELFGDFSRSE